MGINPNHNQTLIRVNTGRDLNHNQTFRRPELSIRIANHNQTLVRG